jgi:hypothetical protein
LKQYIPVVFINNKKNNHKYNLYVVIKSNTTCYIFSLPHDISQFPHRHARQPETSRAAGIEADAIILKLPSSNYAQMTNRHINRPAPYRRHMKSISKQPEQHLTKPHL